MRFTNRRPHYSDRGSPDQKQNGWSYAVNANRDEVEWFLLDSFKYCTFIGYENDPDQE
jgi:hypothetical protein